MPYVLVAQWIERWPAEPKVGGSNPLEHAPRVAIAPTQHILWWGTIFMLWQNVT